MGLGGLDAPEVLGTVTGAGHAIQGPSKPRALTALPSRGLGEERFLCLAEHFLLNP